MAGALKTFFDGALVRRLARDLQAAHPGFDATRFTRTAMRGLGNLELLDRGRHIAAALAQHLPPSYPEATAILLASLGPEHATDELVGAGMAPFFYLPHTIFVAERGLEHFELSMKAQYELTKRFSAEGSIRYFLLRYPERTLEVLRSWTRDANPHVRRLVSEGTRLRLPWAIRVPWLDANPDRVLELLELLKDDRASLVRRSVANSLNDLGKVHPSLLTHTARTWLKGATAERRALIEHALRSAVKRGDAGALRVLGYGARPDVEIGKASFTPRRVAIGARVAVAFTVRSTARVPQELLIDLAVHFIKARGSTKARVFKVKRVLLPPRGAVDLRVNVSLARHTTRKPHPGAHRVDAIVNGTPMPLGSFEVTAGERRRADSRSSASTT